MKAAPPAPSLRAPLLKASGLASILVGSVAMLAAVAVAAGWGFVANPALLHGLQREAARRPGNAHGGELFLVLGLVLFVINVMVYGAAAAVAFAGFMFAAVGKLARDEVAEETPALAREGPRPAPPSWQAWGVAIVGILLVVVALAIALWWHFERGDSGTVVTVADLMVHGTAASVAVVGFGALVASKLARRNPA